MTMGLLSILIWLPIVGGLAVFALGRVAGEGGAVRWAAMIIALLTFLLSIPLYTAFDVTTADMQFGAQDVSKHYHMGSYHQAAEFFEIIFNKDKYEGLPAEHQAILEHAAEAANTSNYALAMDHYSSDLQKLIKDHGVNVYRTDESIMKAQLASWDKVLEKLNEDPFFKKVVDSQKAWSQRVAFYDLMNAADYKLAYKHYFPGAIEF